MLKKLSLVFILFIFSSCNTVEEKISDNLYKKVSFLNQNNDNLSIEDVIKLYEKGDFNIPMKNKVVYSLKGKQATWLHFRLDSIPEELNFSLWSIYLDYSKVFLVTDNKINKLNTISLTEGKPYNSEYRFPSWKFKPNPNPTDVFIKLKDNKRATSLKFLLLNNNEILKFAKADYFKLGIILVFLLIMLVIIITLLIAKKQYSLLWYGMYIFVFVGELLISNGIDLQFDLFTSPIIHNVKKMLFQSIAPIFMGLFFINFYPFTKETLFIKKIFKWITLFYIITTCILLSFILFNTVYLPKIYLWVPGRVMIFIVLFAHIYLIKKKILPAYLGIAFIFPIIAYLAFVYIDTKQNWTYSSYFALENLLQLAFMLEMVFVFYYIINQLVKSEFLAINLQNENLTLRNNFQNSIAEVEQKERNKLLSNVHDSFGGYLETLKLRLLNKSQNTPEKVQEVLDAFYKEYRYLLNSLYSPKINSENFAENLIEFFEKLNQLTNDTIKHQFSLDNTELPSEKCVHLYRIISELTTNSIKYAKATEINVKIAKSNNKSIILDVSDNGIGFDIDTVNQNSYGLKNIKARVKAMNGEIEIKSVKNQGTNIVISIPYNE